MRAFAQKRFTSFALLLALFLPISVQASEHLESPDFSLVVVKAEELAQKYGKRNVLVVYDIDNTLLAPNQDLGSDQWFAWQERKITTGNVGGGAVAKDMAGLFEIQGILFAISRTHTPDPQTSNVVQGLGQSGFTELILTSRGPEYRDATLRELARNNVMVGAYTLPPRAGFPATFLPYDLSKNDLGGLDPAEVAALKLAPARPVSFQNGVFMGSGQHKGVMLRTLLTKTGQWFKGIVFIDDTPKHSERMQAAFLPKGVDLVTIRYSAEDANVQRFNESNKADVISAWETLKAALTGVFK
jgi:hypothetical protein